MVELKPFSETFCLIINVFVIGVADICCVSTHVLLHTDMNYFECVNMLSYGKKESTVNTRMYSKTSVELGTSA